MATWREIKWWNYDIFLKISSIIIDIISKKYIVFYPFKHTFLDSVASETYVKIIISILDL